MIADTGEAMFERLCAALETKPTRLPEAAEVGERRPDFVVVGSDGTKFYAEVKLISPNRAEAAVVRRGLGFDGLGVGSLPGERIRSLIDKANGQLRAIGGDGRPGVLVVFNPVPALWWHTERYMVLSAMRGLDVIDVFPPTEPGGPPRLGEWRSGPKKCMTPTSNTSTAAVVTVRGNEPASQRVDVFHNRYAARPFSVRALSHSSVRHWRISPDESRWILEGAG